MSPGAVAGSLGALALATLLPMGTARAEVDWDVSATGRPAATELVGDGLFLGGLQPAGANHAAGSATALSGYDGARRTPFFSAVADVKLLSWLALRGGATYNPNDNTGDDRSRLRPSVALRAQLLDQARFGADVSVAAGYRQERFAEDGGLLDLTAAVGRRFGRLALLGNVGAAADPEGDDFEGQLSLAALVRTTASLTLGVQGFYRRDLGSTDPRRGIRNGETYDFSAGPMIAYAYQSWMFSVQGGVVGVRASDSSVGAMGLAAVGAAF